MKARIALVTLAAVALALTGCRGTSPSAQKAGSKAGSNAGSGDTTSQVKIMVGGIDKVIYLPAKLTEQLGYFKAEGLDVQLLTEPAGAIAENVLISGDVQGVVGFYDHTIDLQTKGKCIQSVVQLADVPGEAEVVATDKAAQIKSSADFKGKKLGVTSPGSSTDFLTQYLATKGGLSKADFTTVKAGAGQTFIAALENGGIDAGMTTDPTIAQLTGTGKAQVLLDMRTEEGTKAALGGLYPASSLYMDCAWVAAHKDAVQKLANAFVKTLRWIASHNADEVAAKMPPEYAAGGKDLYVKAVHDTIGMFNGDGVMKPEGAKNVLEVLSQFSPNVQGKKDTVDLSKTYTTAFVTKAKA
jgi:NitT/TauT family transport system substrate-binding protein